MIHYYKEEQEVNPVSRIFFLERWSNSDNAKFHYAIWAEGGSNLSAISFEPDSVMKFGLNSRTNRIRCDTIGYHTNVTRYAIFTRMTVFRIFSNSAWRARGF